MTAYKFVKRTSQQDCRITMIIHNEVHNDALFYTSIYPLRVINYLDFYINYSSNTN